MRWAFNLVSVTLSLDGQCIVYLILARIFSNSPTSHEYLSHAKLDSIDILLSWLCSWCYGVLVSWPFWAPSFLHGWGYGRCLVNWAVCVCALCPVFVCFLSFSSIIENNIIVKIRVRYVTTFKIQEGCPVLTKDLWYKGSCFAWLAFRTRNIYKYWVLLHKWTIGIDELYPPRLRILDMSVQESPWVDAFSSEIDSGLRFLV